MKTIHKTAKSTKYIFGAAMAFTCFSLAPAFAQESDDAIEYEFAFAYEEDETDAERQDRLQSEVSDYCDGINDAYYCEEEITTAVNDAMEEDENDVFASR